MTVNFSCKPHIHECSNDNVGNEQNIYVDVFREVYV